MSEQQKQLEQKQQEFFAAPKTDSAAKSKISGWKAKPAGEFVCKPKDLQEGVAREIAVNAKASMVALEQKTKGEFGAGFKIREIEEMRISKNGEICSVRIKKNGDEKTLTLKVDKDSTALALSNNEGVLLAVARQKGNEITLERQSALA